ncbi:MAG: GNAT family N-acetyltransferase [Dehalococcoidia bacterium]
MSRRNSVGLTIRVVEDGQLSEALSRQLAEIEAASPLAHPFQTESCVALFNTDSWRPRFAVVATDDHGVAACWRGYFAPHSDGFFPRSTAWMKSMPVLRADLLDEREEVLTSLMAGLKRHMGRQGVGRAIFTSETLHDGLRDELFLSQGFRRRDLQTYLIDLTPSEDELWNKIEPAGRWAANKARKRGVAVEAIADDDDVRAYYRLYMETASVPGPGSPSEAQFVAGFRRLREERKARIMVARYEGRIVAGSFFPCHAGLAAQLQTAVSREGRKLNAGSLLLWESMLAFKRDGFGALDLVSVEVAPPEGSREAGVREFKSKWGGKLLDTPAYVYLSPATRLSKAAGDRLRGLKTALGAWRQGRAQEG